MHQVKQGGQADWENEGHRISGGRSIPPLTDLSPVLQTKVGASGALGLAQLQGEEEQNRDTMAGREREQGKDSRVRLPTLTIQAIQHHDRNYCVRYTRGIDPSPLASPTRNSIVGVARFTSLFLLLLLYTYMHTSLVMEELSSSATSMMRSRPSLKHPR